MMSVILRIFQGVRVHWISGSDRSKVFSVNDDSALLHDSVRSVPALYFYVPDKVFLIPLND